MSKSTLALATAVSLALSGAALAQTPAGNGSAEGNMNNPASVKSNSEKAAERSGATGTVNGTGMDPGTSSVPGATAPGAPAGTMGTGTTGTGMAPAAR